MNIQDRLTTQTMISLTVVMKDGKERTTTDAFMALKDRGIKADPADVTRSLIKLTQQGAIEQSTLKGLTAYRMVGA